MARGAFFALNSLDHIQVTLTIVIAVPPAWSDLKGTPVWVTRGSSACVSEMVPAPAGNGLVFEGTCPGFGAVGGASALACRPTGTAPSRLPPCRGYMSRRRAR